MSHMRHRAILVSSCIRDHAVAAREKAWSIHLDPSDLHTSGVNGYFTFMVPPDGSKRDRPEADEGERLRSELIAWMQYHPDYLFEWAEVQYGDDEDDNRMLRCSTTLLPEEREDA